MADVQQAFTKMQTAERKKDQDPRGYREAKVAYYRLAQGEPWMNEERARVLEEAKAYTTEWKTQYESLQSQRDSQRKNVELVRAAKQGTLGLQEDVQFAVDQLKRMITREQDRKQLDERKAQFESGRGGPWSPPGWLLTALDFILAGLLFYACYVVYQYYGKAAAPSSSPSFLSAT